MHYDPPNHVREMADSKKLPYAIVLDPSGELAQAFGNVQLTPTTFLIDKAGNIIMEKAGVFNLADMKRRLESLS
jgi:peroxiredoxin